MRIAKSSVRWIEREQQGITGLETAIVLIAFVVVSSVFAFAALSTGLFSSDKSKETIQAGLAEAQGTLEVRGGIRATSTSTAVNAEAVGTGDASTVAFTLDNNPITPGLQTVKLDGTTKTYPTDYTVAFDTGVITFTTAPGSSVAVTADYTYYLVEDVKISLSNAAGGKPVDMTAGETVLTYLDADTVATNIINFGHVP